MNKQIKIKKQLKKSNDVVPKKNESIVEKLKVVEEKVDSEKLLK